MNWKVLVGVVLTLFVSATSTKEIRDTASHITNGLNVAKSLGNFVEAMDFEGALSKLAAVNPYLEVVASCVTFILGFVHKPESAELRAIKKLYTEIDHRFDKVDLQFAQLEKEVHWNTIKVQFSSTEQKINAVDEKFKHIYTFASSATKTATEEFVSSYDHTYQDSGGILYAGIENERVFGDSIFSAVVVHTEYDRGRSQTFMLGVLKLLMKAAKIEIAYHQLKGNAAVHEYIKLWESRFSHIRQKMKDTDKTIIDHFDHQSEVDITNYLVKHSTNSMNNNDFNNGLYSLLSDKYSYLDWLTITYNDINGGDVHYVGVCGGHIMFRNHGRNVVVASVDKSKGHLNTHTAQSIVSKVDSCVVQTVARPTKHTVHRRTDADKAYNTFPSSVRGNCNPYAGKGVIAYKKGNGYDVHIKAAPNRLYLKKEEGCNFVFLFGHS